VRKILEATPLSGFRLELRFDEGVEGQVDLTRMLEKAGVYAPLRQPEFFAKVSVDPEFGSVGWPNDVDLCPDSLYVQVQAERSAA
jgi:hypothetical protein